MTTMDDETQQSTKIPIYIEMVVVVVVVVVVCGRKLCLLFSGGIK
jgi:hypothetical protein